MHDIEKLSERKEELRSEILALAEVEGDLSEEQEARFEAATAEFEAVESDIAKAEERAAKVARVREAAKTTAVKVERSAPEVIVKRDAFEVLETRGAGMAPGEYRQALIDANLRAIEGKVEGGRENEAHVEALLKRHGSDTRWAEALLKRSRPAYESGFLKVITGQDFALTSEERTALSTVTNANGKYAVPTHLDPSVILTNSGTSNAVRAIARVVTLTEGKTWQGLSSAGVTASFDAQLAEVSDDSPTFSQPTVDTHKAQALVQASIEATQDIGGLAGELLMMFADARDRLEGAAHCTGTGSDQPYGIFTAIDATAGSELTSTTAATIGEVDLQAMYYGLPVRHRARAQWLMNPRWALAIKALGTAVSASYSGNLGDAPTGRIYDKPVVQSDDAPAVVTTTALDNRVIFGDFSNYVIVDKPGSMSVEYIPHLFNTSNNLPDGRRGWYAHWRTGADSVNDDAFRLLQDKTSA